MTPQHAKLFMKALADNIQKFESQHGEIKQESPNNIFPGFPGGEPTVN
jgi:hypothetical protein